MDARFLFLVLSVATTLAFAQQDPSGRGRPQMDEATKAKFEACAANMPKRGSGVRPTEAQHEAFKACLKEANINMPEHPHGGHHQGDTSNEPPPPPEE
jgi:hypothetical protein